MSLGYARRFGRAHLMAPQSRYGVGQMTRSGGGGGGALRRQCLQQDNIRPMLLN